MATIEQLRRLPVGAEPIGDGVHFRVWAPRCRRLSVVIEGAEAEHVLEPEGDGWFSAHVGDAGAGTVYRFRPDGAGPFPDPASRFQPDGPHGPSQVIDPTAYAWQVRDWPGVPREARVLYEMHIGTFTPEGTWSAAAERLPDLAHTGITLLEVMPVAAFPGRFGWGYDGVNPFAPTQLYGTPDDFRRFVDRAHALGIGVILDVVYNHLGPDGNYLGHYADTWFSARYDTDWGKPFNVDGPGSGPVRRYLLANVEHWIREYMLDGLRFDATQSVFDSSPGTEHILAELARHAREAAAGRTLFLIGENEPQHTVHVRPQEEEGYGLDALWNDDWHHTARVALTGRTEAYYSDYLGSPQELVSAAKYGFLYQGQNYSWQRKRRGTPALDLPPDAFVSFLQNHDQIANSVRGDRIHQLSSPGGLRALTAVMLLGRAVPLLFQGQEFGASSPFLYFADHEPALAEAVARGRRQFLRQFPSMAGERVSEALDEPHDPDTFRRCVLDHSEREGNRELYRLHCDLLRLRRDEPSIGPRARALDGAVTGGEAFVLRFFGTARDGRDDRLLVVNLGRELDLSPAPEPLLAPPRNRRWQLRWSSEDIAYGGLGHGEIESEDGRWHLPAQSAVLLLPVRPGFGADVR